MKKLSMAVFDCPQPISKTKKEALIKFEFEILRALESQCEDSLRSVGVNIEVMFDRRHDHGVSFDYLPKLDDSDDELSEHFYTVALEKLGKDMNKGSFRGFPSSIDGLARALGDCCVMSASMSNKASRMAEGFCEKQKKPSKAIDRDKALHELLLASSGELTLCGPKSADEIDEMIARVHARSPWLRKATTRIWKVIKARHDRSDRSGLSMPPVLLYGPPGTGKSQLAQIIADASGTRHMEIDAGAGGAGFRIAGVEAGWSSSQIGEPLQFIATERCPNPIIVINEIDKVGSGGSAGNGTRTSMTDALLPLLDTRSAKAFRCPMSGLVCDMSAVNWFLTANDLSEVPAPLRTRCETIEVTELTRDDYIEAAEVFSAGDDDVFAAVSHLINMMHKTKSFSLRHVARAVERLSAEECGYHLH